MGVYTMECFSYDDGFQREIYNKHPIWLQEQEEKRKATGDSAKEKKTSTKAAKKAKTTKTPADQRRVPNGSVQSTWKAKMSSNMCMPPLAPGHVRGFVRYTLFRVENNYLL